MHRLAPLLALFCAPARQVMSAVESKEPGYFTDKIDDDPDADSDWDTDTQTFTSDEISCRKGAAVDHRAFERFWGERPPSNTETVASASMGHQRGR